MIYNETLVDSKTLLLIFKGDITVFSNYNRIDRDIGKIYRLFVTSVNSLGSGYTIKLFIHVRDYCYKLRRIVNLREI